MARYVRLDDRAVLAVSGADASGYLQGLVTNDVGKLAHAGAIHAALLTPQGKYLFDFLVFSRGGTFCLDCEAEARPALAKRLAMYKLRADVAIDAAMGDPVFALFGEGAEAERIAGAEAFADPRHPALGARVVGVSGAQALRAAGAVEAPRAEYDALRLSHGVPDGRRDLVPEKSFVLENGFDELNGVDFEKGCYVGQEVTARMKHR
ncbi:MAG: folate-binding protein, partial [Defluviicoccus sp.]|nr:folate-binding protein [Defluviicoccus sp.]